MPRTATISLAAAAIALALPPAGGAASRGPRAVCSRAIPPGSQAITVDAGGRQRTAVVHVPPDLPASGVPLLLVLHGAGQQGEYFEGNTGFSTIADDEGFVAVYPDALPNSSGVPFWNINDRESGQPDDVAFMRALIDDMLDGECVDPARVYATGMSNGASMAARIGCELSDKLAGIGIVSGGYGSQPPCTPVHPVSILEVHGTADGVVPYEGNAPGATGAVRPFLDRWAKWDGCPSPPSGRLIAPRTLRLDWSGCADGTAVSHLRISGGAHQLPGDLPPEPGQPAPFSAPLMIWRFLARHPRAG